MNFKMKHARKEEIKYLCHLKNLLCMRDENINSLHRVLLCKIHKYDTRMNL